MSKTINQAVVFTKPVHHLGLPLTPEQLDQQTRTFLTDKGLRIVLNRKLTGTELSERDAIRQHYLMYSKAACIDSTSELVLSDEAKARFFASFGKNWDEEADAGKILGFPRISREKGISAQELYLLWNDQISSRKTQKIQDGLLIAYLKALDCYCINAFYPAMEENFYNPKTDITYYVVEFDPDQISWEQFRENILGSTDASKADPQSFRGQLYAIYGYALEYPGRDNFVHGSAGPVEGFVERVIHEPDFDMTTNPVGDYLAEQGMTLDSFKLWKSGQSISQLGDLFDSTEEKNTDEALSLLGNIHL